MKVGSAPRSRHGIPVGGPDLTENEAAGQVRWIRASRRHNARECAEVAIDGDIIVLRDSRNPDVHLRFTRPEMAAFIDGARRGEFDHLVNQLCL